MNLVGLVVVVAAAFALAIWRGVALYKHTFKKKDL
jgi:hypothetical protein